MNLDSSDKKLKYLSRQELYSIRKDKLLREIEAAKRLIESGIEPLKVADEFIHDTFKLMEYGIIRRYPELNPKEVKKKVRENLVLIEKIKSLRKKRG